MVEAVGYPHHKYQELTNHTRSLLITLTCRIAGNTHSINLYYCSFVLSVLFIDEIFSFMVVVQHTFSCRLRLHFLSFYFTGDSLLGDLCFVSASEMLYVHEWSHRVQAAKINKGF